jgi:hypothetical protein
MAGCFYVRTQGGMGHSSGDGASQLSLILTRGKLERALDLAPRPRIAFQAHGTLGMVFYETGDYQRAKQELEVSARLAAPDYIKHAKIWKWLEYTCINLGLKDEARRYGQLARPS